MPRHGSAHAALLERLNDREAATRKAAARDAGERTVRVAAPRLLELLRDHNSGVAATAAWALGRLRHAPAEGALAGLLSGPSAAVRKNAAWALGRIGTSGALGTLLAAWPDADEATARSILLALEEWRADEIAPRLIALLHDPRGQARSRAALALTRHAGESVPLLLEALEGTSGDDSAGVPFRRSTAHVLAASAAPSAIGALLTLSRDADPRTRLYAARGLGSLASESDAARERLYQLLDDERRDVAEVARAALEPRAGGDVTERPAAASALPLDLAPGLTYLLTVLPGLEEIAAHEVANLPGGRVTRRYTGVLLARLDAPPAALGGLRTVLDALLFAGELPAAGEAAARDRRFARAALGAVVAARPDLPLTIYVAVPRGVSRATASALRAAASAVLATTEARVSGRGAALTADVVNAGTTAFLGVRVLSEAPGHRLLPAGGVPASLHATLAAALVRLTEPSTGDVFLDPLRGAGTLLRERALAAPYARLLGGDADERALALARENMRPWPGVSLERWEATRLPLDDASVDKAALNPPYGRRSGSHEENRALYPALLAELARVVRRGGLIALVTAERRLTTAALRAQTELARQTELRVQVGGSTLTIYLLRHR